MNVPAIAGPSHFFPTPFKIQDYRPVAPSTSSRCSTPAIRYERYRSASVVSRTTEDDLPKKRYHSVIRLRTTWDLLLEKYGSIQPEDDDEVDLRTGRIVRDRGRLRELERREFGDISEPEQQEDEDAEGSSLVGGPDVVPFDSDEDELGAWDDRSGLDEQEPEAADDVQEGSQRIWTAEDEDDLQDFLRAEQRRREERGEDPEGGGDGTTDGWTDETSDAGSRSGSDDDGQWNMSPRQHGTRVSMASLEDLFPGDSAEDDDSEDELVAMTSDAEEATRATPAQTRVSVSSSSSASCSASSSPSSPVSSCRHRRPRRQLEVVIVRSRSQAATPSAPVRSRSVPTLPAPPQATIAPRKSVPTLDNLFNSPSPHATAQELTRDVFNPPLPWHRARLQSSSITRSSVPLTPFESPYADKESTYHLKGKARMPGERSETPASAVPSPYYDHIAQAGRSGQPRSCVACRQAGGTRATKAIWCKGRRAVNFCTFEKAGQAEQELPSADTAAPQTKTNTAQPHTTDDVFAATEMLARLFTPPVEHNTSQPEAAFQPALPTKTLATSARSPDGHPTTITREHSFTPPERPRRLDPRRYLLNTAANHNGSNVRRCQPCRKAGGQRAENSPWCKGRSVWTSCTFVKDQQRQVELEVEREATQHALRELTTGPSASSLANKDGGESGVDDLESINDANSIPADAKSFGRESHKHIGATRPVNHDGPTSPRSERASDARRQTPDLRSSGKRRMPRRCVACRQAGGDRAINAEFCQGRRRSLYCTFLREGQTPSGVDPLVSPSSVSRRSEPVSAAEVVTPSPVSRSLLSTRRKRKRVVLTPPPSSPALEERASNAGECESVEHAATFRRDPNESAAAAGQTFISRLSPASQARTTVPRRPFWRKAADPPPNNPSRPTPSPTVSIAAQTSLPPSSPPRPIYPLPHRISLNGIQPTPSPSLADARSSSLLSDPRSFAVPLRSALRQPTADSSSPFTRTAKRARFSLAPRSPPRPISSDTWQDLRSEDDGWVDTSSPVSSLPRFSPNSSSSPFPREMAVRAADLGLHLGPEHTGRLPSNLLAALVPSLGGSRATRATLGSSADSRPSHNGYTLPTPPPSFGQSSSASSRQSASTSTAADDVPHNGLMLPPPVPPKRLQSARPMTPLSITSTSTDDDPTVPQPEPRDIPSSEIRFISGSSLELRTRSHSRSRSRSRSMSVAVTPMPRSTPVPVKRAVPASTPRKRSRLERELAKVAREVGDEAGLEWGMDEDVGDELGRMWREGSVVRPLL